MLATEHEIQSAYTGREKAAGYVEQRFVAPLMELLHQRQVEAVNRVMRERRPSRTLEVAPGPGRLTREVRPSGDLTCLEYNEGMIAEGKAACDAAVSWVQGNAFELPFGQAFDFLYSFRFVRHFHRGDRDRLYAQFRNVLRPGGYLVLDAVNAVVSAPLRAADPESYPIYDKLYRDEAELTGELKSQGFDVVHLEPVQRWFNMQQRVQSLVAPRSLKMCRWMVRGLEALRRGPALEWIVTCRRG